MSINLARRRYSGTPQHPTLFGASFTSQPDAIYWLESTSIPGRDINIGNIPWMNGLYHYVTRTVPAGTWNCSFYVFEDMAPLQWLYDWYEKTFDHKTGKFGTKENYSEDSVEVFLLDSTGETKTLQFIMRHVVLKTIGGIDRLTYEDDSPKSITAGFAFEDFDITFGTAEGLG